MICRLRDLAKLFQNSILGESPHKVIQYVPIWKVFSPSLADTLSIKMIYSKRYTESDIFRNRPNFVHPAKFSSAIYPNQLAEPPRKPLPSIYSSSQSPPLSYVIYYLCFSILLRIIFHPLIWGTPGNWFDTGPRSMPPTSLLDYSSSGFLEWKR